MAVKKKTYDFRCRTLANVSGARRMRRPRSWRTEIARSGTAMSESRTDSYGYNVRNELTSATKTGGPASPEYAYQYDDIGNRITSTDLATNRTYTANNLNQYTLVGRADPSAPQGEVEEFVPQFDDDGNQTLIQTSTGIWSVQYNGENRPVLWTGGTQSAATNIVMSFDRMGRRVEYLETAGGSQSSVTETNAYHCFLYDNYLCIQCLDAANGNAVDLAFVWDVTEPVATRPLIVDKPGVCKACVAHDGNKNTSDIIPFVSSIASVHYEYTFFGVFIGSVFNHPFSNLDFPKNPICFSSEYYDETLGAIYYNYRHLNSIDGRWSSMDMGCDVAATYGYVDNSVLDWYDELGWVKRRSRNADRDNGVGHRTRRNGNKRNKHQNTQSFGGRENPRRVKRDRRGKVVKQALNCKGKRGFINAKALNIMGAFETGILVGGLANKLLEQTGWFDENSIWNFSISGDMCCPEPSEPFISELKMVLRYGSATLHGPLWGFITPSVEAHYEIEKSMSLKVGCCCGNVGNTRINVKSRMVPVSDNWLGGFLSSAEGEAQWVQIVIESECFER